MTRQCGACGAGKAMRAFSGREFVVKHAGAARTVKELSGWRCGACEEVIFDAASAKRYAAAGDALVLAARARQGAELRAIREKLGLTQSQAAALTGGGHNAFSRYERGEVTPMPAVINLLRLLDKHPELLNDVAPQLLAKRVAPRRKRIPA